MLLTSGGFWVVPGTGTLFSQQRGVPWSWDGRVRSAPSPPLVPALARARSRPPRGDAAFITALRSGRGILPEGSPDAREAQGRVSGRDGPRTGCLRDGGRWGAGAGQTETRVDTCTQAQLLRFSPTQNLFSGLPG